MNAPDELKRGRESYAGRAWKTAYEQLAQADRVAALELEDLELLATAAFMSGLEDEYYAALERAHQGYLDTGQTLKAAGCALWEGLNLASAGEFGRAGGWLARAQRLIEREDGDCVEAGYLLLPLIFEQQASGDLEAAIATAAEATKVGERFGDRDLFALAVHSQGDLLVRAGRPREGLELLDEAMVAVTTGELSPIVSGIVYCGVILGCQAAYELRRSREWTAALSDWCHEQPEMVAFNGRCLLHRAEVLQLQGTWSEALDEAQRALERSLAGKNERAAGEAVYLSAEVNRLRGEFEAAEAGYADANRLGREPQPGLALLRLAQGDSAAAAAAIRRALGETSDQPRRSSLLAAVVEIELAAGEIDAARTASSELEQIASSYGSGMLDAVAAQAAGAVELAAGAVEAALITLRRALLAWREADAPYEAGRVRVLVAQACRALADEDAAAMELDAARDAFAALGATPDLERVQALTGVEPGRRHGLSPRELEVLGLLSAGHTNKAIAAELVLSERTVERHVSNIFNKLGVGSRAAATAFAYEHRLL